MMEEDGVSGKNIRAWALAMQAVSGQSSHTECLGDIHTYSGTTCSYIHIKLRCLKSSWLSVA